eukprot:COSAG06_NODE_70098_length_194_cov_14.294737_1_plen_55_part_10
MGGHGRHAADGHGRTCGHGRFSARIARLEESECECGGVDEGDMKKDQMEDMKAEN